MEAPPSGTAASAAAGEGGTAGAALDQELVDLLYHELIDPSDDRKTSQGGCPARSVAARLASSA